MKEKVNKLEENSKNKTIREMYKSIDEFKKGYQPRAYEIMKRDGTYVTDTTSILSRWEQLFSNLLKLCRSISQAGCEHCRDRHPRVLSYRSSLRCRELKRNIKLPE